jgi:hypothetical protein
MKQKASGGRAGRPDSRPAILELIDRSEIMKKVLSTVFAVALATAAVAAFAEDDEAMDVAPNAKNVIVSTPATGPVTYDTDEAMSVAPNASAVITPSPAGPPAKNDDESMGVAPNTLH